MIDAARFWRHVMFLDDSRDTCWIWTGAQRDDGIGRFFVGARHEVRAHHAAYELRFDEPVPPGFRLVSECSEPNCVRHWRLDRPHRKLSDRDRENIRQSRLGPCALARIFHVHHRSILRVRAEPYLRTVLQSEREDACPTSP